METTLATTDRGELERAITAVVGEPTRILARHVNRWASTFPGEVVRCRAVGRGEWSMLCKLGSTANVRSAFGHRLGTGHEAAVYEHVLQRLEVSSPRFFGAYHVPNSDDVWLFIEFLGEGAGVDEAESPADAMVSAATWLGRFHYASQALLRSAEPPRLPRYDASYYGQWPRRAAVFATTLPAPSPWFARLCQRAELHMAVCDEWPQVVIHGEFTPSNVLIRDGVVYPVDWESAAVGCAEIDLVALVEKWPSATAAACEQAYRSARGAEEADGDFRMKVDTAWLYWHFRWLGERADWLSPEHVGDRLERLYSVADRLGLV